MEQENKLSLDEILKIMYDETHTQLNIMTEEEFNTLPLNEEYKKTQEKKKKENLNINNNGSE
jgi:hypothetical protein